MNYVPIIGKEVLARLSKDGSDKVKYPAVCRVDVLHNGKPFVFWIDLFDNDKEFGEGYDGWGAELPHYISNTSLKAVLGPGHKRLSRDSKIAGEILKADLNVETIVEQNGNRISLKVKSKTIYNPRLELTDAINGNVNHLSLPHSIPFLSLKKLLLSLGVIRESSLGNEQLSTDKDGGVNEDVLNHTGLTTDDKDKKNLVVGGESHEVFSDDLPIEDVEKVIKKLSEEERSNAIRELQDLRHIPILDSSQESVKRANVFNGRYQVIDGGPGTGKTTSLIQRIKFLSSNSIKEYITPSQHEQLQKIDKQWLFLSPSVLLKEYLRNAMSEEGLKYLDDSVFDWDSYRTEISHAYGLFRNGNFKPLKKDHLGDLYKSSMFKSGPSTVRKLEVEFLRYVLAEVKHLESSLSDAMFTTNVVVSLQKKVLSEFNNHTNLFTSLRDVLQLYASIQLLINNKLESNELFQRNTLDQLYDQNQKDLNALASEILDAIVLSHNSLKKSSENEQDELDSDIASIKKLLEVADKSNENELSDLKKRYRTLIMDILKKSSIMRSRPNDHLLKFTSRESQLLRYINDSTKNLETLSYFENKQGLDQFLEILSFKTQFKRIGSGVIPNIIDKIMPWYKGFRKSNEYKEAIRLRSEKMFASLLDENRLHSEEASFLIGILNNFNSEFQQWLSSARESFRQLTNENSSSLAKQYKKYVRPIICVDEVSDFSLTDIFCITSFKHPGLSTVTFCGDLLQRTSTEGIRDWHDLDSLLSRQIHAWRSYVDVQFLERSYRQSHSLVSVARELYKSQQDVYPKYIANWQPVVNEPRPTIYVSNDEKLRVSWIAERIGELWLDYTKNDIIPTVAIFVPSEDDIDSTAELFKECDILYDMGIKVVACKDGRVIGSKSSLRIFSVENIKGLEFEAVFFYDIDKVAKQFSKDLTRQFVYVGVSRAAYHLSMTSSTDLPEYLQCIEDKIDVVSDKSKIF